MTLSFAPGAPSSKAARSTASSACETVALQRSTRPPPSLSGERTLDLNDDCALLPGLVDSHVHICDPGNADWEGFAHATRAAAAGGITALVDMPLDSSPTTVDVAALQDKRLAADGQCHVDVGFWAGAIPSNLPHMESLHDAGALGFKCFLCDTGIDEFPGVSPSNLHRILEEVERLDSILLVHAEAAEVLNRMSAYSGRVYAEYLATRPRGAENLAIAQVVEAARATRARAHILHLSSSDALPMIVSAQREGVEITVETCPHYLSLCAEDIADGQTASKVGPPVRERENREILWQALNSWRSRNGRFGSFSLCAGNEASCDRGFRSCLGRHLVAAACIASDVD